MHQKLVRLSSQFEDLQKNMKKVVEFIEKFNKAFEESQTKSKNTQQQASVPSMYWHMVPQVDTHMSPCVLCFRISVAFTCFLWLVPWCNIVEPWNGPKNAF